NAKKVEHYSQAHGVNRNCFKEYSLMHVIKEYRLFKQAVFKIVDEYGDLKRHERDNIMYVVDHAIEQAGEVFFRLRQKVEIDARELAEKKADQMHIEDRLREDFVQSISHDLNSPLNNIKLCVEVMQNDAATIHDLSKLFKIMSSNIHKAEALLTDFLEVKMVNSSGLPIKKRQVNISDLLRNEVKLHHLTNDKPIRLDMSKEKIYAAVDRHVLVRMMDNLISNAINHGDPSREISVCCFKSDNDLIIKVHNYGKPIPEDMKETIFNKYYTSREDAKKGWGIGLAVVKAAVEAHNGEVKVTSSEEDGTEFTLVIPAQ
ncbi:MAG: HAMP domain-containing histidine kinase, partial [Bacteroidetes bacterium]|nr:HAMP domain-containing histidine kinase [Bacteroidota bacterium]